jgi:hypothetical protein
MPTTRPSDRNRDNLLSGRLIGLGDGGRLLHGPNTLRPRHQYRGLAGLDGAACGYSYHDCRRSARRKRPGVIATISTGYFYAIANHADPVWSTFGALMLILAFYADPFLKKLT